MYLYYVGKIFWIFNFGEFVLRFLIKKRRRKSGNSFVCCTLYIVIINNIIVDQIVRKMFNSIGAREIFKNWKFIWGIEKKIIGVRKLSHDRYFENLLKCSKYYIKLIFFEYLYFKCKLAELVCRTDLKIASTFFDHSEKRKWTWLSQKVMAKIW